MFKINRHPTSEPQILQEKGKEWTEKFIEARKANKKHKHSWIKSKVNYHDEIIEALSTLTHEHCSYCDKYPLDARAKIDLQIDHFKPVSKHEELAYEWTNLYLSCAGCNKSKLAQYSDLILRPDSEDYHPNDFFFFDTSTGKIEVNERQEKAYIERAKETIEVFKLNDKSIVKMRLIAIRNFKKEEEFDINDYEYRNFIEELLYFYK